MMSNYSKIEELHNLMHPKDPAEVKKVKKPGIIYLSTVPYKMNVKLIREYFSKFGKVGRIFLQPDKSEGKISKKFCNKFLEGWIEFEKKKVAKNIALSLNNQPVGGKKGTPYHDALWNIKYLPSFKWSHLSEQLSYEKAVQEQRMFNEIARAKRATNHYIQNVAKSTHDQSSTKKTVHVFKQLEPFNLNKYSDNTSSRDELLLSVFGKPETDSQEMKEDDTSKEDANKTDHQFI